MNGHRAITIGVAALVSVLAVSGMQSLANARMADIVQSGKLRVGLFLPQYAKDPASGELRGVGAHIVSLEVARALAARLGVASPVHRISHATRGRRMPQGRPVRSGNYGRRSDPSGGGEPFACIHAVRFHSSGAGWLLDPQRRRRRPARHTHCGRPQSRLNDGSSPHVEARRIRRGCNARRRLRPPACRTGGHHSHRRVRRCWTMPRNSPARGCWPTDTG